MGEAASILKVLDCSKVCDNCTKFVCNAMTFHSKCCGDCMEIDWVTEKVDIPDDVSEISVELEDCCLLRRKT